MIKTTDANEMVKRKILLNEKYKKIYNLQIEGLKLKKEAIEMDMQSCENRIKSIDIVNRIENLQLQEFDQERQNTINKITRDTNSMNLDDTNSKKLIKKKLVNIYDKIEKILNETIHIKKSIPKNGVATNYKMSYSMDTCRS